MESVKLGYCDVTESPPAYASGADCSFSDKGTLTLPSAAYATWKEALLRCRNQCLSCANCRYITVSLQWQDCSWYRDCDLGGLKVLPSSPGSHKSMHVKQRVRAGLDTTALKTNRSHDSGSRRSDRFKPSIGHNMLQTPPHFGVLRVCHNHFAYDECTLSALSVRHHSPSTHQTQFFGTHCRSGAARFPGQNGGRFQAGALERAVDWFDELPPSVVGFGMKFEAMLRSPYNHSLMLDWDAVAMSFFALSNMQSLLTMADFVMVADTGLGARLEPLPMGCTCILGWVVSPLTQSIMAASRARLERSIARGVLDVPEGEGEREHARDVITRIGDQEVFWWELTHGAARGKLRTTYLTYEYACSRHPPERRITLFRQQHLECFFTHWHTSGWSVGWANRLFFEQHLPYALTELVNASGAAAS